MIIDSHTHIFPKKIKQDRSKFFDNEPEFKLLYNSPKAKICTIEQLMESMDRYGIDVSIVCGFPWRNYKLTKQNNDIVIDAVKKYPDKIKGLVCFDAFWNSAAYETQRCIDEGLCGAGELAFYLSEINNEALKYLEPIMQVLQEKNMPCMIHTNEPIGYNYLGKAPISLKQIYTLVQKFADNKIILAHWGGGIFFYNIMKKKNETKLKNVWYDTAASPYLYDFRIYDIAINTRIIPKLLFGTDFPLLTPDRYFKDMDNSNLNCLQKEQILSKNAKLLFNI